MAELLFQSHINLDGNELQNAVVQNLSTAPQNPAAGQFYFDTTDDTLYVFNGTDWINALSQGDYTFTNGLEEGEGRTVGIKLAATQGNVAFTADANGLKASVAAATTDAAGVVEFATDAEFTTGTAETLAVNPKQVTSAIAAATEGMVTEDGAQTLTNKTIDADDNTISDLTAGNFKAGVVGTVIAGTATASATVLASEKAVAEAIDGFIELTDLSIASDSANYLGYNNATGEFSAKVDTTVTADSSKLITSGAVKTAIDNALVGGVIYKGTWAAAGQSDYSAITLPVKQGYMYYVSSGEDVTIDGITWNAGDYLLVNEDVAAGGSLTSAKVQKIDNTEASDIVRLNSAQTLTNKTIDADDNTISDLTTGNFKSGVIKTVLADTASAADTVLVSEKAIASALAAAVEGMVTVDGAQELTNKTIDADSNTISNLELDNFKSGVVQTTVRDTATASDTSVASEKAVAAAVAALPHKFAAANGALTAAAGVCTWTIANSLATADVDVFIYRAADGMQVMTEVDVASDNIVVKFNSASDIAANAYKAVILG